MTWLPELIAALIVVESGGDWSAVGDGGRAQGGLQMHRAIVTDVNRAYSARFVWPRDARDQETARWICELWLRLQLERIPRLERSPEIAARMWNGGPRGHLKAATLGYWGKVREHLKSEDLRFQRGTK